MLVYWFHSKIAISVGVLSAVNFFITPYGSVSRLFHGEYLMPALIALSVLVGGNIVRMIIMPIFAKPADPKSKEERGSPKV